MTPLLSILICSIPSRFDKARKLYEDISAMCEGMNVEILIFTDNKRRSIGAKREAIKNISSGKYFFFVDDDDSLYSIKEIYEACKSDVDVITFKIKCLNSSGKEFIVTVGLGNEVEHTNDGQGNYVDLKRPPFLQAVWNGKYRGVHFPDLMYGEDWEFVKQIDAKTEIHIPEILQGYNFNPAISEAVAPVSEATVPVRRCIVNFATAQYYPGQMRLAASVPGEDILLFNEKDGFPRHEDNPYAFKIYAIEEAVRQGYDQVLFFDASVYAVKPLQPVWDWLTEKGIFLEEAGHYCGSWSNDRALEYFGITRDQAMKMPMFSAGYMGLDFRNPISIEFFAEWKEAMLNGIFKGSWKDHRHDMAAGSIIANKRGLLPLYSKGGTFFAYVGEVFGEPKETVVAHLKGM